ncbi:MAG: thioredoxin domain-containing protein [Pseudomonadales bacterium]|nr:thioredoxin domain-containing protein [Pseudomonadales bacterium]
MIHSIGLQAAREQKSGKYDIRTRHLDADGHPRFVNHLIREASPYLLQHAHNPVMWRSWNEQSFQLAQEENKPVFLSVGYSTCHWCHVMEEESFDDLGVAELINQYFIPIKLDREQRPDLDELYMTALQVIRGSGGWPMSLFLTPTSAPFFGGTYYGKRQFMEILQQVHEMWQEEQKELIQQGEQLLVTVKRYLEPAAKQQQLNPDVAETLSRHLVKLSDEEHGGFGQAPKFPQEPYLLFMLDKVARAADIPLDDNPEWLVVKAALDAMLKGGIYDQVGGGFHRYAVDSAWQVPHFEKMLYNQGQLARVYAQAYQLSGNPEHRRLVEETLHYVRQEMTDEHGLFYSATDADSEGEEGRFFVWSQMELKMLLSAEDYALLAACYQICEQGNFEGRIVLNLKANLIELSRQLEQDYDGLLGRLEAIKRTLYERRLRRTPPLTDHKIITEWNAMMIAAFAEAARILGNREYYDVAGTAAKQLLVRHSRDSGALWRLSLSGEGSEEALLEDYAHLIEALLQLYDVQQDPYWLEQSMAFYCGVMEQYWDKGSGGFFVSAVNVSGPLLVRSKNVADTATISGNGLMLNVLQSLLERSGQWLLRDNIQQQVRTFSASINQAPLSSPIFVKGIGQMQAAAADLRYGAGGNLWVQLVCCDRTPGSYEFHLTVTTRKGWHIDPAKVTIENQSPARAHQSPARQISDMEVLHDPEQESDQRWRWRLRLSGTPGHAIRIGVTVQACSEESCKPAERLTLTQRLR